MIPNNPLGSSQSPVIGETSIVNHPSATGSEIDSTAASGQSHGYDFGPLGKIIIETNDAGTSITLDNPRATFTIDRGGHIDIVSSSSTGINLVATAGKVTVSAVEVLLKSSGPLTLDSGSDLSLAAKGNIFITTPTGVVATTAAAINDQVSGQYIIQGGGDFNAIFGGHHRTTVAGSSRLQVSGDHYTDVEGLLKLRASGELDLNSTDSVNIYSETGGNFHSKGDLSLASESAVTVESPGTVTVTATGTLLAQGAEVTVQSAGDLLLTGTATNVSGGDSLALAGGDSVTISGDSVGLTGSVVGTDAGTLNLGGGQINISSVLIGQVVGLTQVFGLGGEGSVDGVSPTEPQTEQAGLVQAPEPAQTVPAETVVDAVSTRRIDPNYPYNANMTTSGRGARTQNVGAGGGTGRGAEAYSGPPANTNGLDQNLLNTFNCAKGHFERNHPGLTVNLFSGVAARPSNPGSAHPHGQAIDVSIIGTDGVPINNLRATGDSYRAYEAFAYQMKECHDTIAPTQPFRWGGWFRSGVAHDHMHFDVAGSSTALGNWENGYNGGNYNGIDNSRFSQPGNTIYSGPFAGAQANVGDPSTAQAYSGPNIATRQSSPDADRGSRVDDSWYVTRSGTSGEIILANQVAPDRIVH